MGRAKVDLALAGGRHRAEPFHVAPKRWAECVWILCPPLAYSRFGEEVNEAFLLGEEEFLIAGTNSSLVIQSVEHVEVGEHEQIEPFAFLVVEDASIGPSGYPDSGNLSVSADEVIDAIHCISDRVM